MKQTQISQLRQEREKRGWSRGYVAEQIEVDVVTVGRWERSERMPHPLHRQRLCDLFGKEAYELGLFTENIDTTQDTMVSLSSSVDKPGSPDTASQPPPSPSSTEVEKPTSGIEKAEKMSIPSPATETSPARARTGFSQRRKVLLGLAGLGIGAITGGAFLINRTHVSSTLNPATSLPAVQQLSLAYHFLDPNIVPFINRVAWSPDDKQLAAATGTNMISIWDLPINVGDGDYPTANAWVNDIAWSKTNRIAAVTGQLKPGGSLHVWEPTVSSPLWTLSRPHVLRTVSWSPDSKYLVFAGHATTVEVWDADTRTQKYIYSYPALGKLGINRIRWSPTGRFFACAADDGTVHVIDARTGQLKQLYKKHHQRVHDVTWSPDERYLASAGADKSAQIYEALTGKTILRYQGHTASVQGIDWSPQGRYIATGGDDLNLHVWDAFTGRLIARYTVKKAAIEGISWSGDGKYIASGSDEEGIFVWQSPR